jgi:uncharacterized protein
MLGRINRFTASRWSIIIAGALGLHRTATTQYIRPEIIGLVLGALVAALAFREFKPRAGSAPIVRFVLDAFAAMVH